MNHIRHPGLLAILATVACITTHSSGKTGIRLHPREEKRLAAGARFDVAIADTCSNAVTELDGKGQGKIPTGITLDIGRQTCEFSSIESIDKAESSNQAVLTVEKTATSGQYGVLTLQAHEEGEAQISTEITTSTGVYQPGGTFGVLRANKASLEPRCGYTGGFSAGHIDALADRTLTFTYKLMHDSQTLVGYGYYPFELGDLAITDGGVSGFTFTTPSTAGSLNITSPINPTLTLALDVYTRDSIDALNFQLAPVVSCEAQLQVRPSAGKATGFCNGAPEVNLTIETPGACSFSRTVEQLTSMANSNNEGRLKITSNAQGNCRVRGQVVGGVHAESIDIPFDRCTTWTRTLEHPVRELADAGADGVLIFADLKKGIFLHNGSSVSLHAPLDAKVDAAWAESSSTYGFTAGNTITTLVGGKSTELSVSGAYAGYHDAWLLGPGEVVLVGRGADRLKDGALEDMKLNVSGTFYGVWADSANLMYAVGYADQGDGYHVDGHVRRFDGTSWKEAHPDMNKMLNDVWGSGADNVFVVGMGPIVGEFEDGTQFNVRTGGIVMHFDGTSWVETELAEGVGLNAVSGLGTDNVVAVGDNGVVMRWNGTAWSTQWVHAAGDLRAVVVRPDGLVLAGGTKGLFELR